MTVLRRFRNPALARMGDAGEPVVEQPKVEQVQEEEREVEERSMEVASSWSSWGVFTPSSPPPQALGRCEKNF